MMENELYLRQISALVHFDDPELKEDFCKQNKVLAMASVQLRIPNRLIYLKNISK